MLAVFCQWAPVAASGSATMRFADRDSERVELIEKTRLTRACVGGESLASELYQRFIPFTVAAGRWGN